MLLVGLSAGCVQQRVRDRLGIRFGASGQAYAREVEAQSPFEVVSLSWQEAQGLMKELEKELQQHREERRSWLGEVRDFFDAEYYDVRLELEEDVLPDYRGVKNPQLEIDATREGLKSSQEAVEDYLAQDRKKREGDGGYRADARPSGLRRRAAARGALSGVCDRRDAGKHRSFVRKQGERLVGPAPVRTQLTWCGFRKRPPSS